MRSYNTNHGNNGDNLDVENGYDMRLDTVSVCAIWHE